MYVLKPKLSICISVKNRSRLIIPDGHTLELFPKCIDSILNSINRESNIEIIIVDWQSTDLPLNEWLPLKLQGFNYKIVSAHGSFHRSTGRNLAAEASESDFLFFLDADMVINSNLILKGINNLENNTAYFPICFYFLDHWHKKGFWCDGGRGICFLTREMFTKAGNWPAPPSYMREFDEDQVMFQKVQKLGITCTIEREPEYYHQYHPGRSVDTINKRRTNLITEL